MSLTTLGAQWVHTMPTSPIGLNFIVAADIYVRHAVAKALEGSIIFLAVVYSGSFLCLDVSENGSQSWYRDS